MFRSFFVFIAILILISACAPAPQATPQPDQPTTTSSPPLTATPTRTALPSATLTAFITPLPTIPTFTPTFDVSTIVTVTPAPKAECPKEDPNLVPNFELPDSLSCAQRGGTQEECFPKGVEKKFLDYLNSGGSVKSLLNLYYPNGYLNQNPRTHFPQDVTGDETLELLLYDLRLYRSPNIYYCNSGKYELFTFHNEGHSIRLHTTEDLNRNNIPEIVFTISGCSGSGCFGVSIFEWNGQTFEATSPDIGMWGVKDFRLSDTNRDGTKEIILTGDQPGSCCMDMMTPWRYKTIIYTWNGNIYSEAYEYFDKAQYRFQAVQDADREVMYGNYNTALNYYQETISNKSLEWWSKERKDYEVKVFYNSYLSVTPTPLPYPAEDKTEYPGLAAYAYYRIMLLHLVQGHESDATTTYNTLKEKFGNDQYGHPYAEMATAFWNAYQPMHKMYDGCAASIEYAAEHPEILPPLGSDYHGAQSHIYKPEDVCPFR